MVTRSTREAELAELVENSFRDVNIALVNQPAVSSRALGIDFWNVVEDASTKPFGFMPFYPGPGVGGHCLPVDPSYLSWQFQRELGTVSRLVKIADDVSNGMSAEVVRPVQVGLNELEGLLALGVDVSVHDSWVGAHQVDATTERTELTSEALSGSDTVVIVTVGCPRY